MMFRVDVLLRRKAAFSIFRLWLLFLLCFWGLGSLFAQQQNEDEVPGVGADRSTEFGNDTNYGLAPGTPSAESFDQRSNPVNYPSPEEVNRNTISTSLIGLSQGFLFIEWEHLVGRMFGLVFGATLYASEIGQTRRLFLPAGLDNNSFMTVGAILGVTFYVSQQYARGLAIQIKLGGGLLTGSYRESGATTAIEMLDLYGSLIFTVVYRINFTRNVAIAPILVINPNVVLVSSPFNNPLTVPSFFRINGQSDLIGLSAPEKLPFGGLGLFLYMHFGFGVDLTFTF